VKKTLTVFLLLFILAAASFLLYFRWQISQSAAGSGKKVEIIIEEGESTSAVAERLTRKNLIESKWIFYLYMKFKEKKILPGDYLLPNDLSIVQIAGILEKGEHQAKKIIIPEGWRAEQIAVYLSEHAGISADEFLAAVKDKEGRLFPDTYDLTDEPTVTEVLEKMSENWEKRTANLEVTDDLLILASIIERETASAVERADIAGVFANRLSRGMKLEADPTIQYQKDTNNYPLAGVLNYKFWQKLENGDFKKVQGAYNTYLNLGLPPAPICNPGLESIKAALTPSNHNYLYFFHDADGKIYFSTTQAEQSAKEKLYLK